MSVAWPVARAVAEIYIGLGIAYFLFGMLGEHLNYADSAVSKIWKATKTAAWFFLFFLFGTLLWPFFVHEDLQLAKIRRNQLKGAQQ